MSRRRQTTEEERALFEAAVLGKRAPAEKPKGNSASPVAAKERPRAKPQTPGIDGRTAERMRRGQLAPDARLDLHGLSESTAHRALVLFLKSAQARGARLALVVTGKGSAPRDDAPFDLELVARSRGVLRNMVPRWLKEPELAQIVARAGEAHRRHGGAGALYVYLRKKPR